MVRSNKEREALAFTAGQARARARAEEVLDERNAAAKRKAAEDAAAKHRKEGEPT